MDRLNIEIKTAIRNNDGYKLQILNVIKYVWITGLRVIKRTSVLCLYRRTCSVSGN